MKKHILSVIMAVAVIILASCSKNDPTPTQKQLTALDSVKASLNGTWTFQSVTVLQTSSGKKATTTTCAATELTNAHFTDTNWKSLNPEFKYVYTSNSSNVKLYNLYNADCSANTGSGNQVTVIATQNSDDTITLTFSNGINYKIKSKNVTSTSIVASVINSYGYVVDITYKKS